MDPEILIEDHEGIRTLTLNRPQLLNALTDTMRLQIAEAVREFDQDDDLRVLLLTGAGRGFCSGADLSARAPEDPGRPRRPSPRFWWHLPFEQTNKPTICALNGAAAGGGIGLALSCDLVIAADTARLHPAFVGIGLSPDNGISQKIVSRIGYEKSLMFFLSGAPLTSAEALAIGLVDRVVSSDELMENARELATKFASQPAVAVSLTKRLLRDAHKLDRATALVLEEATIALARQTQDAAEGAAAFRERRAPQWKGY
jgi:2-(1,2-epoxy-1,2-dihydrophenyl)acetyl-CoA isomerase